VAINRFDQASRYAAKLDAVGFLCWLRGETPAQLLFRTWLDTRTLPFPGDPERTCDTVAWLADADPAHEWAIPVEFCAEPDGTLFGRLLVYLGQLWLEVRPTEAGGERFNVGAVVVNLTGRGRTSRTMRLRRTGIGTSLEVGEHNLADEDAAATLAAVEAGTLARCVLPWIALMRGADEEYHPALEGRGGPGAGRSQGWRLRGPGSGLCRGGWPRGRLEGSLEGVERG
jgi:hypothetical protein